MCGISEMEHFRSLYKWYYRTDNTIYIQLCER